SIFKEKGQFGVVARQIPSKLLTLEQIGIPPSVRELLYKPRGLVLVTGPTGSGKTTSLASMINIINEERDDAHIITIEDPIEYYHKHKKSLVTQREINVDVPNFAEALRRALRQDPDVVLVGEMRDLETIDAAITAAETGHLVFGTLHTTGAAKTIDRIVNAFPVNQQEQIRIQLSTVLQAVISQLLLPRCDKPGRVAIFEIMINTPSIAALIRDNKTFRINSDIQTGAKFGMVTLDSFLIDNNQQGMISQEEVITKAQDPTTILAKLQEIKHAHLDLETILQITASHLGTEVVELRELELTPEILQTVPATAARMHQCLPVAMHGSSVRVALSDPLNPAAIDELGYMTGKEVQVVVA